MTIAIDILHRPTPDTTIPTFQHAISVVLPAHNEEAVVEQTLTRCLHALARLSPDYEVILVDDGSRDRTGSIADAIAARDPHVRVVHNRPNRGYGGALKAGFEVALKDYTFFMDADGQFDIAEISRLLVWVDNGFRAVFGYRDPRRDPFMRLVNAWGWNLLISGLFGLRVRDIDCAFKLYETSLVRAMDVAAQGATINAEMLIKLARMGVPYAQVRVTHYPRLHGSPSGASLKVIARAFRELVRLRGRLRRWAAIAPPAVVRHGEAARVTEPAEALVVGVS